MLLSELGVIKEHNLDIKIISVETFDEAIESLNNN